MKIVMVGGVLGTAVGQSLRRAALQLGHAVHYIDHGIANSRHRLLRALAWRMLDRRPVHLVRAARHIVRTCREQGADLLLTTGAAPVPAEALLELKAAGVATANFSTDDPWNTRTSGGWYRNALLHYDFAFTPRTANLQQFQALGGPVTARVPFAYDEHDFYLDPSAPRRDEFDAVFVGGCDQDRVSLLSSLLRSGLRIGLFGDYWQQHAISRPFALGGLNTRGLRMLRARTAVSICLVRRQNRDGHVMRTFEAAACGECLLVERTAEHEEIFGPDGECVRYFETGEQLPALVQELSADPGERERLAAKVVERVARGHRYLDRMRSMLEVIGRG